jgi:hypothetical protein
MRGFYDIYCVAHSMVYTSHHGSKVVGAHCKEDNCVRQNSLYYSLGLPRRNTSSPISARRAVHDRAWRPSSMGSPLQCRVYVDASLALAFGHFVFYSTFETFIASNP